MRNIQFTMIRLPLIICCLLLLSGCGRRNEATVSGTVTLDGRPLTTGTVTFNPKSGVPGYAKIGADASYAIQTVGRPGLSTGEYVVTVVAAEPAIIPSSQGGMPMPGKSLAPTRYATVKTSGLRFVVQPGVNQINLELNSR